MAEVYETGSGDNAADDRVHVIAESQTKKDKETPEEKVAREKQEKTLKRAFREFKAIKEGERQFRLDAKDDAQFRVGTKGEKHYQWPASVEETRKAEGRIVITINRMPAFIRQVTNAARAARLRITVNPSAGSGKHKVKLAEVIQGIIRNIENDSFADRAYNKAADKQAEQGRGYFRLITEWADPGKDFQAAFRQKIKIRQEKDPLAIYVDLNCLEADYSDATYAFKVSDLDDDQFEAETGEAPPTEQDKSAFVGDDEERKDWFPAGRTRYVEYFRREPDGPSIEVAELSTGDVIKAPDEAGLAKLTAANITVKRTRKVQKTKMVWRKMTALKIYSESTWVGNAPPWIPVLGDENEIDGQVDYRGVTRDAKGPATIYNVEAAALLEAIGLGIKAPVVGYKGQFGAPDSELRKAWETANIKPRTFLEVEPITIDGKPAPIPVRNTFEAPIEGIIGGLHQADEDYKSTAGFHDAALGERGPQESGKAITARQRQDELGSSHYIDNLRFSLCSAGRQLIRLIRVIYDVPTVIRITGNDDVSRDVMVYSGADNDPRHEKYLETHPLTTQGPNGQDMPNQPLSMKGGKVIQPGQKIPHVLPEGVTELYDLSDGEFDVEVSAGPDPGTRRQEQLEAMTGVFKTIRPEITEKFLDLFFQLGDLPVFQQMSERAKKLGLGMSDDDGEMSAWPPEAQALIGKMKQELQQAQQQLQAAGMKLATKQPEIDAKLAMKRMELQHKEFLARFEATTEMWLKAADREKALAVAEIMSKAKDKETFYSELQRIGVHQTAALDRWHDAVQAQNDRTHEAVEGDKDRAAAATAQASSQAATSDAQVSQQSHEADQAEAARAAAPPVEGQV